MAVWPIVEIKRSPIFSIVAKKESAEVFIWKVPYLKYPQKSPNISATFVRKFVAKIFKKSPNLVTLVDRSIGLSTKVWIDLFYLGAQFINSF